MPANSTLFFQGLIKLMSMKIVNVDNVIEIIFGDSSD
jgi:hypothetical protein